MKTYSPCCVETAPKTARCDVSLPACVIPGITQSAASRWSTDTRWPPSEWQWCSAAAGSSPPSSPSYPSCKAGTPSASRISWVNLYFLLLWIGFSMRLCQRCSAPGGGGTVVQPGCIQTTTFRLYKLADKKNAPIFKCRTAQGLIWACFRLLSPGLRVTLRLTPDVSKPPEVTQFVQLGPSYFSTCGPCDSSIPFRLLWMQDVWSRFSKPLLLLLVLKVPLYNVFSPAKQLSYCSFLVKVLFYIWTRI